MGKGTTIESGPGNVNPTTEYRQFKANGAIAKGDVVGFALVTAANGAGYVIDQCTATTIPAIGVAAEAIADGAWGKVVISGFCDYVKNDGTDVVAGDFLAGGAGVAAPVTAIEANATGAGYNQLVFGQSMVAETSTVCDTVMIFKRI